MPITIIGIDCATQPRHVGLALGSTGETKPRIHEVVLGSKNQLPAGVIAHWVSEDTRTLLALDAPLGWPTRLGQVLSGHQAGDAVREQPSKLFKRLTDRVIAQEIGKHPLEVGADRIARTAHAALNLLEQIRMITGQTIPLAWSPGFRNRLTAIEVYPAATLTAHGLTSSSYKKRDQHAVREMILGGIVKHVELPDDRSLLLANGDALDAVICVLAALDFLEGCTIEPVDMELVRKEGWIWVREPTKADS